jgi:hypothetical protein
VSLTAASVSAVLVTRGDVDLAEILASLPYDDVVVWNNAEREDLKTYGRYAAIAEAKHDVIYFQDDDILFKEHDRLMDAYEPGVMLANMSPGWVRGRDLHDSVFVGAGALLDRDIPAKAFAKYDRLYPRDELFYYYPEALVSIPSRIKRVDLPLTVLPWGYAPNRMNAQPWFEDWMAESIKRGRRVRDECAD